MKSSLKIVFLLTILAICAMNRAYATSICPTTSHTNSDCSYILTIGSGGTVSGAAVAGAAPYDGSDDALIGIVNNSGAAYTGGIVLSGSGNGGGLFAFDGDGICAFTSASYCSGVATGYEGPDISFSNIMSSGTVGTVNVLNLANGATTFFSLESSPASITSGGGITIGGQVPEPASIALLATGLLGAAASIRRRMNL